MNESEDSRLKVWKKGKVVPGSDPAEFRKDDYGYWMRYSEFRTEDKLSWDFERRFDGSVTNLFPISRIGARIILNPIGNREKDPLDFRNET